MRGRFGVSPSGCFAGEWFRLTNGRAMPGMLAGARFRACFLSCKETHDFIQTYAGGGLRLLPLLIAFAGIVSAAFLPVTASADVTWSNIYSCGSAPIGSSPCGGSGWSCTWSHDGTYGTSVDANGVEHTKKMHVEWWLWWRNRWRWNHHSITHNVYRENPVPIQQAGRRDLQYHQLAEGSDAFHASFK